MLSASLSDSSVQVGQSISISGSASTTSPMSFLSVSYLWGDGLSSSSGTAFSPSATMSPIYASHAYTSTGTYTISVTATATYAPGVTESATSTFSVTVTPTSPMSPPPMSPATVTITGEQPAYEGGAAGVFRFTRTGDISQPLNVPFNFSGTASSLLDYDVPPSFTIRAGLEFDDLLIPATNDTATEATETITLTLRGGTDHTPGSPASDSINLFDNDAITPPTSPPPPMSPPPSLNLIADVNVDGDDGTVAANKSWINFVVRDYAAKANLNVWVYDSNGTARGNHTRQVVRDSDSDGLQDKWEVASVVEFTAQTGIQFLVAPLKVFSGKSDNPTHEIADPDGANADGGRDLGTHKTQDDSLTVFQEYRGFILDGGGFDGTGQNGHAGGHKRLSPAFKELLVEVDAMPKASVASMPTSADLKTVLELVAKGFSDRSNGAGVRVYWVVDEPSAAYQVIQTVNDATTWARTHRNTAQLGEFVHLMFTGDAFGVDALGFTSEKAGAGGGCLVFPNRISNIAPAGDFLAYLANTAAHELTHSIIDTPGANGFDAGEHEINPDPADGAEGPLDLKYLMIRGAIRTPRTTIIFSDTVLAQIDLTRKESVEV